jgi:hypothetical protein
MSEFRIPDAVRSSATPAQPVQIYRLAPPEATLGELRLRARSLGLAGDATPESVQDDAVKITYAEGDREVSVYKASAGLRYHDGARWQVDDGQADIQFSDEDATGLAEDYVQSLGLASAAEMAIERVSHLRVAAADRTLTEIENRVIDVGVIFHRVLDGVPVLGPGGKITVYIDQYREITGIDRIWRTIARMERENVALVPYAQMLDGLTQRFDREGGVVDVLGVQFGYYEWGWEDRQEYLQPAYVIDLRLSSATGRFATRVQDVVAAAVNPIGPVTPPPVYPLTSDARRGSPR